jgi:hypothetical protein
MLWSVKPHDPPFNVANPTKNGRFLSHYIDKPELPIKYNKQVGMSEMSAPTGNTSQSTYSDVRFEVFTEVTMKNGIFWYVTPCGSCKNRRFGGT